MGRGSEVGKLLRETKCLIMIMSGAEILEPTK